MFDLSLGEILLVLVAALLCIGPKEIPAVTRSAMSFFRSLKNVMNEVKSAFSEMTDEPKTRMIKGDDGKMYESYDVDTISSPWKGEGKGGGHV